MGFKLSFTYEQLVELCKKTGTILKLDKKDYYGKKTNMNFVCSLCHRDGEKKSVGLFIESPWCRHCSSSKAKNGGKNKEEYFEELRKRFKTRGWKLLANVDDYEDHYSKLRCLCPNKHEVNMSLNNFTGGSNCMICTNKSKTNFGAIEKKFILLHLQLLITMNEYVNKDTKFPYICTCGRKAWVSWGTAQTKKWKGCKECMINRQRHKYDEVEHYFKKNGCVLLSSEYKSRHDKLYYLCLCGEYGLTSYARFKKGSRCYHCTGERRAKTNIQKYGCENVFANEEIKKKCRKTMMEKYGVEYNLQSPELLEKALRNSYQKKEFIFPSGRKEFVMGYEPFGLKKLMEEDKIHEDDIIVDPKKIPKIKYNDGEGNSHFYFPDMFIESQNTLVEIKSTFTYNVDIDTNFAKWYAAKDEGYNMYIYVFDKKGNCVIDMFIL